MAKHQAQKLFSFAAWASDHPSDPIPGDRLDIQLDNHRQAIRALQDLVQSLLRADGKLNHDLITPESLPAEITSNLTHRTRAAIEAFADPLLARAKAAQSQLEASQLDLQARLEESRQLLFEARRLVQASQALAHNTDSRVRDALTQMAQVLKVNAQIFEDVEWNTLQANTAQDWALVSTVWAEYMDGNAVIPPNILASNGITGDHWSSRWWANRAASAFGMLAWWYMGAWPGAPPTTPNTPTGQPIPPGAMYFDTVLGVMLVWNGSGWVPLAQGPAKATTSSLYYLATASQTVFPLTALDLFGKSFSFNQTTTEGLHAHVNGVRLTPVNDYGVNTVSSIVTLGRPVTLNAVLTFDILTNASLLAPTGTAKTYLLSALVPDGVKTNFTGLTVAAGSPAVSIAKNEELLVSVDGVQQQPGLSYNASGSQITFSQPPDANSSIFIVWFGP